MEHIQFKKIYEDNYPKVIRLCLGYSSGDDVLAQDLAQDVFIKVWENLDNFRNESSVSTWIYRITVNTCLLNIRQGKKIKTAHGLPTDLEDESENTNRFKQRQLDQLYSCIGKLNKENKAIILLELEGIPQKEIANIIGIKHEAVRVRIHRIKTELTKCVKNEII